MDTTSPAADRSVEDAYNRLKQAMEDAEASGDGARILSTGAAWVSAFPSHAAPALRLAAAQRATGDIDGALATIQVALRSAPKDLNLLKTASKLCALKEDYDQAIQYRLICAEYPNEARESMLSIARFRAALADSGGAQEALEDAIAAGETRDKQRLLAARIAYLRRDRDSGLALLDSEEAENGLSQEIENIRRKLNNLPAARESRPAIRLRSPATSELRTWAEKSNIPTGTIKDGKARMITEAGDMLIDRAPDSRSLLLTFGGLSTMFGGVAEDMEFVVRNVAINTIFVSDPQRLFMLGGFASVGEYWTSIGWLKDLKHAWGIENFYCLGLSGGGYPAIRYGLDLGARRVLTFAAPTEITPTITQTDKRATALANRVLMRKPHMCVNLRAEIARFGTDAPQIINYYGADMREDSYHARNIEGLPTVSLRPVANLDSHAVIAWLKQSGSFREILQEFLGDAG